MIDNKVTLIIDIRFDCTDHSISAELKEKLLGASHIAHHIAENAVMGQLNFDGLKPTSVRNIIHGVDQTTGEPVILRDSGWR